MDEELRALEERQRDLRARVETAEAPPLSPAGRRVVLALDVHYAEGVGHVGCSLWQGATELGTWAGELEVTVPYVSGYFCFREGPPLLAMIARLRDEGLGAPDLVIVDGHGIAHPRRFGVACWLGVALQAPTLGCAKDPLLPSPGELSPFRGGHVAVWRGGEEVGAVLRTQNGVNPLYVSPGHQVGLAEGRAAILDLPGEFRLPDPLRRADHAARMRCRGDLREQDGLDLGVLAPVEPPWGAAP